MRKKYWNVSKYDSLLHKKITTQTYSGKKIGNTSVFFLTWELTVKIEQFQKLNGLEYESVWVGKGTIRLHSVTTSLLIHVIYKLK